MKFKWTFLMVLMLLAIFTIACTSAADNLTNEIVLGEDSGENNGISSSEVIEETISQTEESVLTQSVEVSSYSELANKIEAAKGTNLKEYTINLKGGTYSATGNMIEWGSSSGTKTLIINGNGATLDGNNQYAFMKVQQDYTLVLNNIRIVNFAKHGTSGFVSDINGGAVYVADLGSLVIDHCEFANNHAKDGGAIYSDGILVIRNSIFAKNSADSGGGAIETKGGKCDIQSSVFENNNAQTGGAIYAGSNGAIITNNLFTKNEAGKSGGAIHNGFWRSHDSNIVVYDRWGNRIEGTREYFGLDTSVIKNIFTYNKAEKGSAVNNVVSSILIDSNEFYSNSASSAASEVIVNDQADVDISGNVIRGTNYYTISNSGKYSKITNNLFDDARDRTFTIAGAGTYLISNGDKASTKKATPKLTAKKATFKAKAKVKKYSITIKAGKKALAKVKVYLKVKGKTYSAKTKSNGKATFKIKNLKKKGTYKATITFKGDKSYNKVTKTVKIKVK